MSFTVEVPWLQRARTELATSSNRPKPPADFVWRLPALIEAWQEDEDGDTIVMGIWFSRDLFLSGVPVRAQGINAIEKRAKFGAEATAAAKELLPEGELVTLLHTHLDKYAKRFLAQILKKDGSDFGTMMLVARASDGVTPLAVPYLT